MFFLKFRSKSTSSLESQASSSSEMEKASLSSMSELQESPITSQEIPRADKIVPILTPEKPEVAPVKKESRFVDSLHMKHPWTRQNHTHTEQPPNTASRSIAQTLAEASRSSRALRRNSTTNISSTSYRSSSEPAQASCLLCLHSC